MRWHTRAAAGLFLILSGAFLGVPMASAVDVSGDDANDQFVGSGDAGSHSSGSAGGSQHSCAHCTWMAADPCSLDSSAVGCGRLTQGCPAGQEQRRMWFSLDYGLTWFDRGLECVGATGGGSVGPSAQALHETFARAVPAASISSQPSSGLLPQVPTLFASGQPAALAPSSHRLGSLDIVLSPTAHWHWDFGDGGTLDTQSAGSRYPDLTVSHVYRRAGSFQVRLRTSWTATYTVDGQGPFAVDGPVVQFAAARIEVGQGRAVLS